MKGFDDIFGTNNNPEHEVKLLSLVKPRTCGNRGQASAEWFLDCGFSATSSTADSLLVTCAKSIKACDDNFAHFETVLKYAKMESLLKRPSDQLGDSAEQQSQAEQTEQAATGHDERLLSNEEKESISQWIESLTNPEMDVDAEFKTELHNRQAMLEPMVMAMLRRLSGKPGPHDKSNHSKLNDWLTVDPLY
jgi:hypothetical protein